MVTYSGRCPSCQSRTTPGVGKLAGLWICMPCKQLYDNYGNPQDDKSEPKNVPADKPSRSPSNIRPLFAKRN